MADQLADDHLSDIREALSSFHDDSDGMNFIISQIEELCINNTSGVSSEEIEDLMFLCRSKGLPKHMGMLTKALSIPQPNFTATPRPFDLFYECSSNGSGAALTDIEKEMSMSDIVRELGYGCTVNTFHLKEILSIFLPLTEVNISKLIGTVARTYTGIEDAQNVHLTFCSALDIGSSDSSLLNTWNVDAFVDSVNQLAPKTNWTHVIENLDHEGFNVPDETSFSLLMSIYIKACQDPFPLHAICGSVWNNAEGQLSFLGHAVMASPTIFTFAHCSRKLTYPDLILTAACGNQAWFCLDLLEVLCKLAEMGHITSVRLMLEYPVNEYPEILLVGIAQINTAYNLLQYELSSTLFPVILKDSTKTSVIHHLWSSNPNLVLLGFVDAHSDPNNLFRILDICQELKILSSVLETTPFPFSIKLASIASRKEYLNLEKWLDDHMNTYKDAFAENCLKFMEEVLRDVANDALDTSIQDSLASILNVYRETCSIFFKVLQDHLEHLTSHELFEELKRLHTGTELVNPEGNSSDIDREANVYFHQMFAGLVTVDGMVQLLRRFKDSPEKRELALYDCIVANLFEEYKFFPKYPDKQLKLTAVLFGSLIKHELVTHLTLGIALRGVLDALRKSVDSKMFMFGTTALEQFIDRLIEWPQYCNHILQISHMRGTHADLVSSIERALARVSSSLYESNGGNILPADQQQASIPAPVETMEASEGSWQLTSSSSHFGQLSPFQQQQRHQGLLDDRLKTTVTSASYTKPILPLAEHTTFAPATVDSLTIQKANISQTLQARPSQHSTIVTSSVSSSNTYVRPSRSITSTGVLRQLSQNTGFGAALNIGTLMAAAERRDTEIEAPVSEVQDKVLFMINNISTTNMDAKAKEFTEVLNEQYYPWFAQYMVMKRASIEPNFHDLYLKFLAKVNSVLLNDEIMKATYENCQVLLRSDLIKSSSEERSLLKNLGSWLGKFTIGRNYVLLAREINPKSLIIEAYEKGLMIAVIPFTSKILEPCVSSLAYQPPNPWTMAILALLAEIYNLPNLKMNLKFDIEVLFKNLAVDMKDVESTSLLKGRVREVEGNPDFSNKDITVSQPPLIGEVNSGILPTLNHVELPAEVKNTSHASNHPNVLAQYTAPLHIASNTMVEDEKAGALIIPERVPSGQGLTQVIPSTSPFHITRLRIPNSDSYININPKLSSMGPQMKFQSIIQETMDEAIKEIVSSVVQKSVVIAIRTTKEIVLKDYILEVDDSVLSRPARLMVGTLAGSLAHVTCKDHLRVALSKRLRDVLSSFNVNIDRAEQIIQIITTDHLDLGCALIENVASEKAVELIDGEILASLRKQRELSGPAYYGAGTYSQGPFARVPEALRPKSNHLSVAQQRVYDDFIRNIWQNQPSQNQNVVPSGPPIMGGSTVNSAMPRVYGSNSGQLNTSIFSNSQIAPGSVTQPLDLITEESDAGASQILSVSSIHVGSTDGVIQPSAEISPIAASFPAASSAELHLMGTSTVTKEPGASLPLSSSLGTEHLGNILSDSLWTTGDALDKYQQLAQKLENFIAKDARETDIQGVVADVPDIILKSVSRDEAALAVAQKVFRTLYDNSSSSIHISSYLAILEAIRDVCKLVVKELTSWVIYSDEDRKFNKEVTIGLIRSELLSLADYNVHLAKLMDGGRNKAATEFAISLVHSLLIHEPGYSGELYNVMDVLTKLAMKPGSPETLQQLIEIARNTAANSNPLAGLGTIKEEKTRQSRDKKIISSRSFTSRDEYNINDSATGDPAGFLEKVTIWFDDWCQICDIPATTETTYSHYISQLQQNGWLKGDDVTDHFFRILTSLSVTRCLSNDKVVNPGPSSLQSTQQLQHLSFFYIDTYAKLVALILKYCSVDQGSNKLSLLPKILSVTVRALHKEAEDKKSSFNPRPYFRLFVNWLFDLLSPDPVLDAANFQVLTSFANAFHAMQPLKVPGWSFAWLELVSHRSFMPKILTSNSPKGWPFFQRLLVDLFKFMEPYLRNAEMGEPVQFLYKGTLRVLLVLLHDFPEFLCDYHFSFCDVIPPSCIQMRNVILSAFPRNMRLPDPATPNLKIDLLAEISLSPRVLSDVDGALKAKQIKADIDDYLKTRPDGSFLSELKQRLLLPQIEASLAGTRYNVPLMNSLVLYVGMQAIQQLQSKSTQHAPSQQMTHSPPMDIFLVSAAMDIFSNLIKNLDTEGRYLFLNAIANQLRYPNNHTHYFSFVLLYLFAEAGQDVMQDIIQEQITRVLLERLIVNRPHPWGLLITFIELIKNSRYRFWEKEFTRCAPEIEKLFDSVSRSCGGPKTVDDGMVSAGIPGDNH